MIFNSIEFLVFFPVVFFFYWYFLSTNLKVQNLFLLIVSYLFYGWWDYRFLLLILTSTIVDYFVGICIHKSKYNKKKLLFISVLFNLSLLGFFKYYNFFIDSLRESFSLFGINFFNSHHLEIILPVGISFYTFQTLSYTFDIFYGKIKPTKNFIGFATFVAFFPQLVAGPIEKANILLPQILNKRKFSYESSKIGLSLIIIGFFKKILVADNLGLIVDDYYHDAISNSLNSTYTFIIIIFYSIQIYCDFSGYSDIAIGVSRLFGIRLNDNFKRPYFSLNPVEFWRRWHISLSSWFRDYLFIPLGGSRISKIITFKNVLLVFLLSGLWHGANWTFIIWGLGHFIFYITYDFNLNYLKIKLSKPLSLIINFLLVSILWIPFRSNNITECFYIISNFLKFDFLSIPFGLISLVKSICFIMLLFSIDLILDFKPKLFENTLLQALIICIIIFFGNFYSNNFIYFQF